MGSHRHRAGNPALIQQSMRGDRCLASKATWFRTRWVPASISYQRQSLFRSCRPTCFGRWGKRGRLVTKSEPAGLSRAPSSMSVWMVCCQCQLLRGEMEASLRDHAMPRLRALFVTWWQVRQAVGVTPWLTFASSGGARAQGPRHRHPLPSPASISIGGNYSPARGYHFIVDSMYPKAGYGRP